MKKMVPHRITSKKYDDHRLFQAMNECRKSSVLDEPFNIMDIECERFNIIPISFSGNEVMKMLTDRGYFDFENDQNMIYLPLDKFQAYAAGRSPYGDPPIESYCLPLHSILREIQDTQTVKKACEGDRAAIMLIHKSLLELQNRMRRGLDTAQLFPAFPYSEEDWRRDQAAFGKRTIQ